MVIEKPFPIPVFADFVIPFKRDSGGIRFDFISDLSYVESLTQLEQFFSKELTEKHLFGPLRISTKIVQYDRPTKVEKPGKIGWALKLINNGPRGLYDVSLRATLLLLKSRKGSSFKTNIGNISLKFDNINLGSPNDYHDAWDLAPWTIFTMLPTDEHVIKIKQENIRIACEIGGIDELSNRRFQRFITYKFEDIVHGMWVPGSTFDIDESS